MMTECHRGHVFIEGSYYQLNGRRNCKECIKIRSKGILGRSTPCEVNTRKTHCINGHPLDGTNLHIEPSGSRRCRLCRDDFVRKCKYGITREEYIDKIAQQNNLCIICNRPEKILDRTGNVRALVVDHDHKTGQVRDLLCGRCNSLIGFIDENIETAIAVVAYLEKWKQYHVDK